MQEIGPDPQASVRPEKQRGQSSRYLVIVAGLVMALANARRLGSDSLWIMIAIVGVVGVLAYVFNRQVNGNLKSLTSRAELSDAVSGARGMRQMNLLWYEYVIARNVARGTYRDEPPIDFKSDVYDASMRMGMATKSGMRQVLWLGLFFLALSIAIPLFASGGDTEVAIILFIVLFAIFFVSIGGTAIFMWFASRRPLARLGRRIEAAAELDQETRWQTLLSIASEEARLGTLR